jgi:ribose transport system substrate-binding protein
MRVASAALALTAAVALVSATAVTAATKKPVKKPAAGGAGAPAATIERLNKWYAGTDRPMPTTAPAAKAGLNVWAISCGEAYDTCNIPQAAVVDAGKAIGWKVTAFDGKANPDDYANGIRAAIADKADGIIANGIDCYKAQAAFQEAKKAGIPVVSYYALDCDEDSIPEFNEALQTPVRYGKGTYKDFIYEWGKAKADWFCVQSKGAPQLINMAQPEYEVLKLTTQGFADGVKENCPKGKILATVTFRVQDILDGTFQPKVATALNSNPTATGIHSLYDTVSLVGVAAAIKEAGKAGKVLSIGGEGSKPNMDLIRGNAGQDAIIGLSAPWVAWAAVDELNRVVNKQPAVDEGIGFQIIDREHNLPATGAFEPKTPWKANYLKLWGKA